MPFPCGIVRGMVLVGLFAFLLFLLIVVGDWMHFTSLTASASRYGFGIAKIEDRLPHSWKGPMAHFFDTDGLMNLPHGVARLFQDEGRILLRPQYRLSSRRFRTAWPIKGSIAIEQDGDSTRVTCIKRIPWSSAILTLLWFGLVGVGTVGFVVVYALEGGMASLSTVMLGVGITGVGILVFLFGLIIVSLAYRLENDRLGQAYKEFRQTLAGEASGHD